MTPTAYYPYRSEAAKDSSFAYLDRLAATSWPVVSEETTVPTSYGPTFVRVAGRSDAPPLVLLPGAGATSLMWAPNIQALSAEYRTFAVDQINNWGRTICTKIIRSFDDLLAWLDELLEGLAPGRKVNLAGLSYGGAVAAQFALRFPAKLDKVVLLAPGNTVLRVRAEFMLRIIPCIVAPRFGARGFMRWMFTDMARKDPTWIDSTVEQFRLVFGNMQRRYTPFPPVLSDDDWRSFNVPALFLVGDHEVIYSAEKAVNRLKQVAPKVVTEIIPGAGHDLTFVHPEIVNQRIIAFLGSRGIIRRSSSAAG